MKAGNLPAIAAGCRRLLPAVLYACLFPFLSLEEARLPPPCLPACSAFLLQTGDVMHAFFRFGPFSSQPPDAAAAPAAPASSDSSGGAGERLPLLMLSGLGSTMVSWGVPLMRALSLEHEVRCGHAVVALRSRPPSTGPLC
jgi:hypothetical protein